MVESALQNAHELEGIETLVGVDRDDPRIAEYMNEPPRRARVIDYPHRMRPSEMWQVLFGEARGEILMLANDDILFRTPGWDRKVEEIFARHPDRLVFAYTNDLEPAKRQIANHWFVSRRWCELLGFFTWTGDCGGLGPLEYFGNDTVQWRIAQAAGRCVYMPDVVCEHMHFKYGKAPKDSTYTEPRKSNPTERDAPRLAALAASGQYAVWAAQLRAGMHA